MTGGGRSNLSGRRERPTGVGSRKARTRAVKILEHGARSMPQKPPPDWLAIERDFRTPPAPGAPGPAERPEPYRGMVLRDRLAASASDPVARHGRR
jgi:hypothetical protein